MRKLNVSTAMLISAFLLNAQAFARDKDELSLRMYVNQKNFELAFINNSDTALTIDPALISTGPARDVEFFFFDASGRCEDCKMKFNSLSPLANTGKPYNLRPTELIGKSVPLKLLVDNYNIKSSCYSFFAIVNMRRAYSTKGRVTVVSNVQKACF